MTRTGQADRHAPKVFISYSHDSKAHAARVRGLSDSLRRDGVDCTIDQYLPAGPPEGWPLRFHWEATDELRTMLERSKAPGAGSSVDAAPAANEAEAEGDVVFRSSVRMVNLTLSR